MNLKSFVLLIFTLVISFLVSGQNKVRGEKSLSKVITPPNGIYLRDSIFIDKTEITNIAYLEYLHYLHKDSALSFYLSQLPDTTCWLTGFKTTDSVSNYTADYFRYPSFRYFPVVGVSYEQALNFCKWRGDAVTMRLMDINVVKDQYPDLKNYEIAVEYRLPTVEEWEFAAYGGLDKTLYPHGIKRPIINNRYTFKIGRKSCSRCLEQNNIKYDRSSIIHKVEFNLIDKYYFNLNEGPIECPKNSAFDLAGLYDFPPNNLGLYNMIGNVSEMTDSKGISKGGSFRDKLKESTIEKEIPYEKPEAWLGYRCVAIVHLRKKLYN